MENLALQPQSDAEVSSFQFPPCARSHGPLVPSRYAAALNWFRFDFAVIPIATGTKIPAVTWDPWLAGLSSDAITAHWSRHPDHDVGFIVGSDYIVLDADSPESIAAIEAIEARFGLTPKLVVKTRKGVHHYYRLAAGTFAKPDSHCTDKHPGRIDVKTGRAMVVLPPSAGRSVVARGGQSQIERARELSEFDQACVDAVFAHNGRQPPRPPSDVPTTVSAAPAGPSNSKLKSLAAVLRLLEPDDSYDTWLRIGAVLFHETGGTDDGLALFDEWSAHGDNYCGAQGVRAKWTSFRPDHPHPAKIATLRWMLANQGHDWVEVCAAAEDDFDAINADAQGGE